MKTKQILFKMVITAMFIALTFGMTYVFIPLGVSKIHLGNLSCVLAGLLFGGIVGGLAGSIGMGLNDIVLGYGPDTYIRTFIVKFALGYIAGSLFRVALKNKFNLKAMLISLVAIISTILTTLLVLYFTLGEKIAIGSKTFTISTLLLVSLSIFDLLFVILLFITNKVSKLSQYVLIGTTIAMLANIILEFLLKIPLKMLFAEMTFNAAFIYAVASLPSALITAVLTIVIAIIIYLPVYTSTKKINKLNDIEPYVKELEKDSI